MKNQRQRNMPAKAAAESSVKSPRPPFDPWEVLERNLDAMRAFYRGLPGEGPPLGQYVAAEIAMGDLATAVRCAREGKDWTPPKK